MILLRPPQTDADRAWLLALRNDPEIMAYGDSQPATEAWLQGDLQVIYAPVGFIRRDAKPEGVEYSIALIKEARGRGIGTEAITQELADERWKAGGPRRVFARIKGDNVASARAFLKAGFYGPTTGHAGVLTYETDARTAEVLREVSTDAP